MKTRQPLSLEKRARRRVALKLGLAVHATVFLLVNLGLWGLAQAFGHAGRALPPLAGWGLGLAIHAAVVAFKLAGEGLGARWVSREIEALRRREGAA